MVVCSGCYANKVVVMTGGDHRWKTMVVLIVKVTMVVVGDG